MYPKDIFLGLDLYDIFICIGVIVCIYAFGIFADKLCLRGKLQRIVYVDAIVSILTGYIAAVIMQAVYNIAKTGKFEVNANTGATFYGGLIGGAAVFIGFYFIVGHFLFRDGYHKRNFFLIADCAISSVVVAHAFGRIGCLMAGCCHGKVTDAWYGIMMHGDYGYQKYVPVQLFESIFLFILFAFLVVRIYKNKTYNLPIYMVSYGVWRYFIEFLRGDIRGGTFVEWLSPSQLTAIIMIVGGIVVYIFEKRYNSKHAGEILSDAQKVKEAYNATTDTGENIGKDDGENKGENDSGEKDE